MPKIALDAMGGDKAPAEIVRGAATAAREWGLGVRLVGQPSAIESELQHLSNRGLPISIVEALQTVEMDESPTSALRHKPQSSIAIGIEQVKSGNAEAFVSAGNTGAVVAHAVTTLGMMEGIERPTLALLFRTLRGRAMMVDVGATSDCRPNHLLQFGQLGSLYLERVLKVPSPRVGLLNIGEEESKGNRLSIEAYHLLKNADLNFVGNVEGKDIFQGEVDLIVTDGFTGNIALKLAEGTSEALFLSLRQNLSSSLFRRALAFFLRPAFRSIADQWDYRRTAGALLLGIKGNVVIAHGRSDALAIKTALGVAQQNVQEGWLNGP